MDLQYIRDIRPDSRNWKVKVIVCDKTQARVSPSSPNPYQRIILMDETEQKVIATTYGTDINTIGDQLHKYNIYNYPFQWTLKYFTKIRFQRNDNIHPSILNYRFASLQGLNNYIGKQVLIDEHMLHILAVVIEKRGQHHVKIHGEQMLKKEYIIMNEERATVLLTLWNNIAMSEGPLIDNSDEMFPIIRATSLAISPFQGSSLGSTSSTIIAMNPQIPEATNLYNCLKQQTFQPNRNTHHAQPLEVVPIEKVITERQVRELLQFFILIFFLQDTQFLVKVHSTRVLPAPKYFFVSCQYSGTQNSVNNEPNNPSRKAEKLSDHWINARPR
ncbi:hypothetical protein ACJIZ3_019918 [Penstemon smallii]|uniref:Replication protein A n=1 Tax=Penstemon smallii TaxID=265156 RepID=A0ABD3T3E3_9LAMI